MNNKAMEKKIATGEALDLKDCDRVKSEDWPGEAYLIPEDSEVARRLEHGDGVDICDSSKELWMWSVGRRVEDDKLFASAFYPPVFYEKPGYNCLWLR